VILKRAKKYKNLVGIENIFNCCYVLHILYFLG